MDRIVIFADLRQLAPRILLPALLEAAGGHGGVRVEAVYALTDDTGYWSRQRTRWARRLQSILGTGHPLPVAALRNPLRAGRGDRVPCRALPDGDANHPGVTGHLRPASQRRLGVNLYCTQRFGEPLLDCFEGMVNYHNGRLPAMRGLRASNWSIYRGERRSGYAFHWMDTGFDTGNIVAQDSVPVGTDDTPLTLELRKAQSARSQLPDLLAAMVRRDPGTPQTGAGRNFSRAHWEETVQVEDPGSLPAVEWQKRLRAFLRVWTRVDGQWLGVTAVTQCTRPMGPGFRTADGSWLRVTAVDFWPVRLAAVGRRLTAQE